MIYNRLQVEQFLSINLRSFTGGITRLPDVEKLLASWAAENEVVATMAGDSEMLGLSFQIDDTLRKVAVGGCRETP